MITESSAIELPRKLPGVGIGQDDLFNFGILIFTYIWDTLDY
ncbi:hypothetical protein [Dyadobacter sp. CY351]|nr:hypothetical protein [Dyadobacter sp. CY351]